MPLPMSYEPLSPAAFLLRAGRVFADRLAVVDGARRYTYAQFLDRALRLAGALRALGAVQGARVAVLAPNTHVLLEAHYGVPYAGAVLVATGFNAGVRIALLQGRLVMPWLGVGAITTRVETEDLPVEVVPTPGAAGAGMALLTMLGWRRGRRRGS